VSIVAGVNDDDCSNLAKSSCKTLGAFLAVPSITFSN
jgi:hypothetical protein